LKAENEDLVNLLNWLPLNFRIADGDWFSLSKVEILDYRQELDVIKGVLTCTFSVRDRQGRETKVTNRCLVHMEDPHIGALELTLNCGQLVRSVKGFERPRRAGHQHRGVSGGSHPNQCKGEGFHDQKERDQRD
jgi:trehalose/maltose hydrolase-like predicted phosphorylase